MTGEEMAGERAAPQAGKATRRISGRGVTSLGVAGAGTMGRGIALAALLADLPAVLYDVSGEVLSSARDYIETHLNRKRKAINLKYLQLTSTLEAFAGCEVVVEAIPEQLALKQALFSRLEAICPPPAILATNTSTLSVTAIAAAVAAPERVAGMHFFNPAPVLPLVEVIRAARTAPEAVETLVRLAERLGKTPVVAGDTPGFIVNRVARPFYGEALRLLGEGVATHEQIDRIVREGGGFRMGPFELMDLIGIDVNFAATQSVYEQTFFEPRYRPHLIQAQMVAQQALGRKTGRGFYPYDVVRPVSGESQPGGGDPQPATSTQPLTGPVLLTPGSWAPKLVDLLNNNGLEPQPVQLGQNNLENRRPAACFVVAGEDEDLAAYLQALDRALPPGTPLLCQCVNLALSEITAGLEHTEHVVGFDGLFLEHGKIACLVAKPELDPQVKAAAESLFFALGRPPVWIEESPGLVLPRIVCALVNEAAFAAGEGVADAETIDRAMQLGATYPLGPLAWGRELGYRRVLAVLEHLQAEYREERYRPAPLLRRLARGEK
ncbi:MAG TPA: 3-hydroxyacyl-CoA dehydrogenase NAD-binding domain-containing protein [Anaerolineales bacterium]|nr:3-hydroxyacyl-CoA dehydrogenase NAD-binding domain-containing protein [Anaerolineales bacterium]